VPPIIAMGRLRHEIKGMLKRKVTLRPKPKDEKKYLLRNPNPSMTSKPLLV
jgi:hypothetical protein